MGLMKLGKYKLQKMSRAYYIAIPRSWVKSKGLVKGAKLEVALNIHGNLSIKPFEEGGENEV